MPSYNFHLRTQTHTLLGETREFAGSTEARVEAARRVGELLKTHAGLIWVDEEWRLDVTDEAGLILFVLYISAMKTPATDLRSVKAPTSGSQ